MTSWLLPLLIFIPLLAGLVQFLAGPRPMPWWPAGGVASGAVATLLLLVAVARERTVIHAPGDWPAPLGIVLQADGLSAILLLLTTVVIIATWLHTHAAFANDRPRLARFRALCLVLWAALNALFLSADLFNIYVALEMVSLTAIPMMMLARGRQATDAALAYLMYALLGSLLYLGGVALIYGLTGRLDLDGVAVSLDASDPAAWLAAALMITGILIKAAIVPFHVWLPPAHASAPAPVSALLSALVVKAAIYLLLRLWIGPLNGLSATFAASLPGLLGATAIIYGALQALRQEQLKQVMAWSTVSQSGYLLLFFPLASTLAWQGAVYHGLTHGLAKAAMFLAAGNLLLALGHDRVRDLAGAGFAVKLNLLAFAIAGISLMGLPPTGGFAAKWLLLSAALESGQWWWALIILAGSLLAATYVLRALQPAFLANPATHGTPAAMVPLRDLTPLGLALAALLAGLVAAPLLSLLGPLPQGMAP